MKRLSSLLTFILFAITLSAQSVVTTVTKEFKVSGVYSADEHLFRLGDTVTVYGFKKKSDKYHFVVETRDYANLFSISFIPFSADEKQLKKLPNALNSDMDDFVKQKKQQIENRKRQTMKEQAISGRIKTVLKNYGTLSYGTLYSDDAIGNVLRGDTICLLGYKSDLYYYYYALYSNKAVGVFKATTSRDLFEDEINLNYLPSIDDPDVIAAISRKKQEFAQREADAAARYREDALNGRIKGILYLGNLETDDYKSSPFKNGDTLSIVGYSKKSVKEYYAVYSPKGAGVYRAAYSFDMTFKNKNEIQLGKLPSVDDPQVLTVLDRQQKKIDSLKVKEDSIAYEEYIQAANKLIKIYKDSDPVLVTVDSWDANSAGGIEVYLSVTNCSMQTIKYISFQGYFTNAVGDKCRNEIGGGTTWKGRGIGPIGPRPTQIDDFMQKREECKATYSFDTPTFYSRVAQYFHLSSVTIQYMKGKTVTLSGNKLKKHVIYN